MQKNHFLILKKLKNTESAHLQFWAVTALYEVRFQAPNGLSPFYQRLYMGKLDSLFLLSEEMGQFVWEKLQYNNIFKLSF